MYILLLFFAAIELAMEREEEFLKCGYHFPVHKLKQHVMGCKLV